MYHLYISNFKRFVLLNFLIIVFIGLIIDFLFYNLIILKTDSLPAYKYYKMLNEYNEHEIPILGSSRALGSYVPSLINQDAFNYGMDGSGFSSILFMLDEELKKDKKSNIIINLDFNNMNLDKESAYKIIPIYNEAKELIPSKNFLYTIPFVRFFGNYMYYVRFHLRTKVDITKIHDKGGLFEIQKKSKVQFLKDVAKRKQDSISFNINKNSINLLTNLILKTEREIWFIVAPYHTSFLSMLSNNTKKEIELFVQLLERFDNVKILDYSTLFNKNEDYFFDTTHITYEGAKVFSKIIKNRLKGS